MHLTTNLEVLVMLQVLKMGFTGLLAEPPIC